MSLFNKDGKEFTHLATIQPDPKTPTTYSHKFPTLVGNKVVERWSTKVRPIKDLTHLLRGCQLKRNQDYMVDYNAKTGLYEYWFEDSRHCLMFVLASNSVLQTRRVGNGHQFSIECPHCALHIHPHDIKWV
jgi:hypothetical protein